MRRARIEDAGTLLKLAKMVHFINLPADREIIIDKVMRSRESFIAAAEGLIDRQSSGAKATAGPKQSAPSDNGSHKSSAGPTPKLPTGIPQGLGDLTRHSHLFMFVLEDTTVPGDSFKPESEAGGANGSSGGGGGGGGSTNSGGGGAVIGTSQIISRMGGPGAPNLSFKLTRKEMFSTSLQTGATHMVAKLILDESGPTELGGLILQPSFRGHKQRLGRFLSLVRFHAIGLFRPMFSSKLIAEMMAPLTADGRSTLWEYLGRRFINLSYVEADRFCQYSKEFMTSLLPREEIYLTLLPPEARAVIAQVGPETVPARRMLERLGFEYRDHIDPFDGGPHLEAETDKVPLIRTTSRAPLGDPLNGGTGGGKGAASDKKSTQAIVSVIDGDGEFRAIETQCTLDRQGRLRLPKDGLDLLSAEPGMLAGWTPLPSRDASQRTPSVSERAPSPTAKRPSSTPKPKRRRASNGGDR